MGEFCLLFLLCMLPFPVPLTSLHAARVPLCSTKGGGEWQPATGSAMPSSCMTVTLCAALGPQEATSS
jgi:hypothetical protein